MFMCLAVVLGLLSSCSGTDYLNAIPKKSTALISVDMQQMSSGKSDEDKAGMLKSLLHVEDASKCGIDISEKIFLFESADGNLGLCAKVSDEGDVEDWLASLAKQHIATEVKERKGFHFSVLKNSWLVGFSDQALLVMGPVVADAQAQLQQQMVKYLKADEDEGITASPMFERLETITSPMAMVAQAQALPEKFVAPFTLGTPKDTDPSQVVIAAEMGPKRDILGELKTEVEKEGMVLGASSHRAEHYWFFNGGRQIPEADVNDPEYADLYGPVAGITRDMSDIYDNPPSEEHMQDWLVRTCEIVDKYHPSIVYFDWWIQQYAWKPYLRKFAAYYYNRSAQWGKETAIDAKFDAYVYGSAVNDLERGQLDHITPDLWQNDTSVAKNSWGYTIGNDYKKPSDVVLDLIDVVSKNGALLLNIGPKPDGTIPEEDARRPFFLSIYFSQ